MENLDTELTSKRADKKAKHSETSLVGETSSSSSLTDTNSIDEDAGSTELRTSRSRVPKTKSERLSDNKNRLKDRFSRARSKNSKKKKTTAVASEESSNTSVTSEEFPFSNPLLSNNAQKRRPAIKQAMGILKNNYYKDIDTSPSTSNMNTSYSTYPDPEVSDLDDSMEESEDLN